MRSLARPGPGRARARRAGPARLPLACVIGDMDLIRPLGLAGIRCAAVAGAHDPVRFSRFTDALAEPHPMMEEPGAQGRALLRFGAAAGAPPGPFYGGGPGLLGAPRHP